MAELPWFKVYAAETLSDENFQGWDCTERGAWFTLICVAWREGSIPADQQSLAKLLHVDSSAMRSLWSAIGSRFVEHPDHHGRLTSPRLEKERETAAALHAKKVGAGKNGARSRWDTGKRRHSRAMAVPSQTDGKAVANDSDQGRTDQGRDLSSAQGRGKGKSETDPRFAPLKAAWLEEFKAARRADYTWSAADALGVHRVITASPEELRSRARRGLQAVGFLRCGTLAKLTSNEVWNQLAGDIPPNGAAAKPRVIAGPGDFSDPEKAREGFLR
jgi:hypothetical protein